MDAYLFGQWWKPYGVVKGKGKGKRGFV